MIKSNAIATGSNMQNADTENVSKQARGEVVRNRLLDAVETLLQNTDVSQLKVSEVLHSAGVARATLYHHFRDLEALAEEAMLRTFARNILVDVQTINQALASCENKEAFVTALRQLTIATQSLDRAPVRFSRAKIIAMASTRPPSKARLVALQSELTEALTLQFDIAQRKNWLKPGFSPRAGAMFIQGYTFGRLLLDTSEPRASDDADWLELVNLMVESVFIP
jgi:AcrR family transcriptional regulator